MVSSLEVLLLGMSIRLLGDSSRFFWRQRDWSLTERLDRGYGDSLSRPYAPPLRMLRRPWIPDRGLLQSSRSRCGMRSIFLLVTIVWKWQRFCVEDPSRESCFA